MAKGKFPLAFVALVGQLMVALTAVTAGWAQRGPGNPTEAQDLDRLCNTAHSSHGSAAQHVTE